MQLRIPALLAAVAAIAAASSCGDPTAVKAQFPTVTDTLTVYAFNGTSPTMFSAVRTRTATAVVINSDFNFDIAWDINEAGDAVAYPVRALASELMGARRVGVILTTAGFEAIHRAPTSGYEYDSVKVVPVGDVLLVDVIDPTCSAFSLLGQNIRSKIVVDSVNTTERAIHLRITANPNCGFKDFTPGIPKD